MVFDYIPRLKRKYKADVIIANGENAASGRGITKAIYDDLLRAGVDVVQWETIHGIKRKYTILSMIRIT